MDGFTTWLLIKNEERRAAMRERPRAGPTLFSLLPQPQNHCDSHTIDNVLFLVLMSLSFHEFWQQSYLLSPSVSYTWAPGQNNCDTQCNIAAPLICNNAPNAALVQQWQAAGKKVILSFGGAGMGGSWSGDVNNCWDYCFGKEEQVASQLVQIVKDNNFDGGRHRLRILL